MTDTQQDWEKEFEQRFREEPDKDNEEMYFEFFNGCVEFRKGYRGYDSFMIDVQQFIKDLLKQRDEELVAKIHKRLRLPVDDVYELEKELIALVRERGI